jgi:aminoglycoside 6'-N-acetyltransferase
MLGGWLAEPHVHRWWCQDYSSEAVEKDFGPIARGTDPAEEPGEDFIVTVDHKPIGLIQRSAYDQYPEDSDNLAKLVELPQGAYTVDYLIGAVEYTDRGIGPAMIAATVADLWTARPRATCVIVPVHEHNRASWRALEAAGFTRISRGELPPDNPMDNTDHVIYRTDRPLWPAVDLTADSD